MKQFPYPPIELLKRISAQYPQAWEQMEMFHKQNGTEGLPHWENWCYAPISAALAVTMGDTEDVFDARMSAVPDAQAIAALAPWRQSKEVFVIDPDLEEMLFSQSEELTVNSEILYQLPYQCFYIQFSQPFDFLGKPCHGVFVHLEDDVNTHDKELRLLYLRTDGKTIGEPIHIGEETLEESLTHTRTEAFKNIPDKYAEIRRVLTTGLDHISREIEAYRKTLQIILYLCAQNAEIAPDSEQAFITKRSTTGKIRDRYAEIRKWDVGFRIGAAVRKNRAQPSKPKNQADSSSGASHASPRPHMRRAHWHNFWTGSKSSPESRKLVLKWVAPTIVGIADYDDSPVTLHIAKKED